MLVAFAAWAATAQAAEPAFTLNFNRFEGGAAYNFFLTTSTHFGGWAWQSAGSGCGPRDYVVQEGTRQATEFSANCEASLGRNAPNGADSLEVDGKHAYTAYSAKLVYEGQATKPTAPGPGEPVIGRETHTLNPATGALAEQSWEEELATCKGVECESFEGTGVRLVRTITLAESGLQATVEDRFESTDGRSHTITVSYGEEQINTLKHPRTRNRNRHTSSRENTNSPNAPRVEPTSGMGNRRRCTSKRATTREKVSQTRERP